MINLATQVMLTIRLGGVSARERGSPPHGTAAGWASGTGGLEVRAIPGKVLVQKE